MRPSPAGSASTTTCASAPDTRRLFTLCKKILGFVANLNHADYKSNAKTTSPTRVIPAKAGIQRCAARGRPRPPFPTPTAPPTNPHRRTGESRYPEVRGAGRPRTPPTLTRAPFPNPIPRATLSPWNSTQPPLSHRGAPRPQGPHRRPHALRHLIPGGCLHSAQIFGFVANLNHAGYRSNAKTTSPLFSPPEQAGIQSRGATANRSP